MEWMGEPGPWVDLDSVMESEVRREGGIRVLELRIRWLAAKAGQGQLGPWLLRLGTAESVVEALPVDVLALGQQGSRTPTSIVRQIPMPSAVIQQGRRRADIAEWTGKVNAPTKQASHDWKGGVLLNGERRTGHFDVQQPCRSEPLRTGFFTSGCSAILIVRLSVVDTAV